MKKSQIMAVFALALALGAVAPIAGIVGGASALTVEVKDGNNTVLIHGKATLSEAASAVATVKGNDDYKNIVAFKEAIKAYDAKAYEGEPFVAPNGKATVIWVGPAEASKMLDTLKKDAEAAAGHVNTETAAPALVANSDEAKAYATPLGSQNDITPAIMENIIAAIEARDVYKVYRAFYDADSLTKFQSAINGFNDKYTTDLEGNSDTYESFKANDGLAGLTNYDKFKTLFEDIDRAKAEIAGYKAAFTAVDNAYKALEANGQITTAGKNAYKAAVTDVKWPAVAQASGNSLAKVVLDAGKQAGDADIVLTANVLDSAAWNKVAAAIKNVENLSRANTEDQIYHAIEELAKEYKTVTKDTDALGDVVAKLVNAKANVNGGTGDDQNGDNTDADVNAPNTGILSSAEGSATTISIVAGLTTALASLGAGVVAYRSARRGE